MDERIEDLLAIYALGGLGDEETRQVEAYLKANPEVQEELDSYLQVVGVLAHAASPLHPAETIESSLMSRVETDARARFGSAHQLPSQKSPERSSLTERSFWQWLTTWLASPGVSVAGLAFAAIALVFAATLLGRNGALTSQNNAFAEQISELSTEVEVLEQENSTLSQENETLADDNLALSVRVTTLAQENADLSSQITSISQNASDLEAEIADLVAMNVELTEQYAALESSTAVARNIMNILTSPTVDTVSIPGNPETQPNAAGQFVVDASSNTAILIVTGLTPLPEGSVYQVLLIQGSEHETAETFLVDTQGESVLIVSSEQPLGSFDAVGVSIEPEGGSPQRTGEVVLIGSLIN